MTAALTVLFTVAGIVACLTIADSWLKARARFHELMGEIHADH